MEDIEIGEYVRTIQGTIAEIEDKDDITINGLNEVCYKKWAEDFVGSYRELERIVKHSKNIIDLIVKYDVVEFKVGSMEAVNIGIANKFKDARSGKLVTLVGGYKVEQVNIIKILTHEQYEQNAYKIKESD